MITNNVVRECDKVGNVMAVNAAEEGVSLYGQVLVRFGCTSDKKG